MGVVRARVHTCARAHSPSTRATTFAVRAGRFAGTNNPTAATVERVALIVDTTELALEPTVEAAARAILTARRRRARIAASSAILAVALNVNALESTQLEPRGACAFPLDALTVRCARPTTQPTIRIIHLFVDAFSRAKLEAFVATAAAIHARITSGARNAASAAVRVV